MSVTSSWLDKPTAAVVIVGSHDQIERTDRAQIHPSIGKQQKKNNNSDHLPQKTRILFSLLVTLLQCMTLGGCVWCHSNQEKLEHDHNILVGTTVVVNFQQYNRCCKSDQAFFRENEPQTTKWNSRGNAQSLLLLLPPPLLLLRANWWGGRGKRREAGNTQFNYTTNKKSKTPVSCVMYATIGTIETGRKKTDKRRWGQLNRFDSSSRLNQRR